MYHDHEQWWTKVLYAPSFDFGNCPQTEDKLPWKWSILGVRKMTLGGAEDGRKQLYFETDAARVLSKMRWIYIASHFFRRSRTNADFSDLNRWLVAGTFSSRDSIFRWKNGFCKRARSRAKRDAQKVHSKNVSAVFWTSITTAEWILKKKVKARTSGDWIRARCNFFSNTA